MRNPRDFFRPQATGAHAPLTAAAPADKKAEALDNLAKLLAERDPEPRKAYGL